MKPECEKQIDLDIAAFVNGQLDAPGRYAVAEYLAAHPERAAEVMADLRLTEGLRLALGAVEAEVPASLSAAADRLGRSLGQRHRLRWVLPMAAAACMFALGWSTQAWVTHGADLTLARENRSLIEAALDAQEAVALRMSLSQDIGPLPRDAKEISARLGIALPHLPADWRVAAAQVVSTPERPGVALVIDTPDMGRIMLFSVIRTLDGPDAPPDGLTLDGRTLAYFEKGRAAYVLVDAAGPVADLTRGAEALRNRLN